MNKRWLVPVYVGIVLAIDLCSVRAHAALVVASNVAKAKVLRVLDGDTVVADLTLPYRVVLKGYKFRLYGVDTPETDSKDPAELKAGEVAKKFTSSAVYGKDVLIRAVVTTAGTEKMDSFGRYLVVVFYKDSAGKQINLNEQLVQRGLAREWKPD